MGILRFEPVSLETNRERAVELIRVVNKKGCMSILDARMCVAKGFVTLRDEELLLDVWMTLEELGVRVTFEEGVRR